MTTADTHDWLCADVQRRVRAGNSLALVRACGLHKASTQHDARSEPITIIDATAGLGREAFILASRGARVHMFERHPETLHELRRTLDAASGLPQLSTVAARMMLLPGDSVELLRGSDAPLPPAASVIYLDPMFTDGGHKASAKRAIQALRDRTGGDDDAAELAAAALQTRVRRIVIKRAAKAPVLVPQPPTFVQPAKQIRFDVYDRPHYESDH